MLTVAHLLQVLDAAGATDAVYLSVPITSGVRELALLRELNVTVPELRRHHHDRWIREVVELNSAAARGEANATRSWSADIVIDPSRMDIEGWDQGDYNAFWHLVMRKHVAVVVAGTNWQYSKGARSELWLALEYQVPVRTIDGDRLEPEKIRQMASDAAAELNSDSRKDLHTYLPPFDQPLEAPASSAASKAFGWLAAERAYQVRKFGLQTDDEHTAAGLDEDSWWWQQLANYLGRARVLSLETPVGRQALAKFTATAMGLLESTIRVYGDIPAPGVASGEIILPTGPEDPQGRG